MNRIESIIKSKLKPKEKILLLAGTIKRNPQMLEELFRYFDTAKDPEKGSCLSAITENIKEDPAFAGDYIDSIINSISYKAPRVKWEASEIIGHASKAFPMEAARAIPMLIENTNDKGTVVKWSAAFGLTEIAKNNKDTRKKLIPFIKEKAENEINNGVKKLYLKALKFIEKENKIL